MINTTVAIIYLLEASLLLLWYVTESDISLSWSSSGRYPSLWMPTLVLLSISKSLVSSVIACNSISSAETHVQCYKLYIRS